MDPSALEASLLVVASVILAGSIVIFAQFPRTRAYPGPVLLCILFSASLCIIFRAILHLSTIHMLRGNAKNPWPTIVDVARACLTNASFVPSSISIPFWCSFYFSSASTFWYLMLATDLISSLSNPFLPFQANSLLHHLVAWPCAGFWIAAFSWLFQNETRGPTATPPTPSTAAHLRMWMIIPVYGVLAYIIVALLVAWTKSRVLETQAHTTTRRMAKLILPYLLVFGLGGLMSLCLYFADAHVEATTRERSTVANVLDQLTELAQLVAVFALFQRKACWANRRRSSRFAASSTVTCAPSPMAEDLHRATEDDEHDNSQTLSISNVLRQCIMKYTSMGIVEGAQGVEPKATADIQLSDYSCIMTKAIVVHGRFESGDLTFYDCAPAVFHDLRTMFGVTQEEYIASFALDQILDEHGSEGKSGNIFYFTANKKFMVKSVPEDEYQVLRSILPYYHNYLQAHPESYLCRYFGCHSISLPVGSRRMYFVVMQNLFNEGAVDQRFDLKGNTDRRQAIQSHDVEQYIVRSQNREAISKLMMDIDFLKLRQTIQVDDMDEANMQSQLIEDITFLATRDIMDYSILLGVKYIHNVPSATSGTLSKTRERIYYLGIIDMLQRYTWRWTLQRWFLGLFCCKDMSNVSAVPPNEYGTRLKHFVRTRLFYTPGKGRWSGWTNPETPRPSEQQLRPSGPSAWTTEEEFLSPTAAALWRSAQSPFHMQMVPPHRASGGFFVASSF
ncbi:unnamed protein product [Aphanomyces euteiches]